MQPFNLVQFCDRYGLRWLAGGMVFLIYLLKGQKIRSVKYNSSIKLWEYQIADSFFLTLHPSWFSSTAYCLQTFQKYSGHYYLPKLGETVIDVGAGVGEEVLAVAQLVGAHGKIYAIEANPKTFSVLDYFCKKNKLGNTFSFNIAIAKERGQVFIEDDGSYGVQNSISSAHSGKKFIVAAQSLDDFMDVNHIHSVDLMKANIEGAEQFLVQGMSRSITKIKRIAISCHDFRFAAGEAEFYKTKHLVIESLSPYFDLSFQQSGDPVRDHYVYGVNKNLAINN
jgi:FkbM family methyltransferase